MAKTESLPTPRELEDKEDFIKRFASSARLKATQPDAAPYKRRVLGEAQWEAAKMRSVVSIRNSEGEWLLF